VGLKRTRIGGMMTVKSKNSIFELPMLPLRDLVVFPHMVVPLIVGRPRSRAALGQADAGDGQVLLVAQRNGHTTSPEQNDIFEVGTIASIHQMLRLPDDNLKVLVEGKQRARIIKYIPGEDHFRVQVELIDEADRGDEEISSLLRSLKGAFEQFVKLNKGIPPEMLLTVAAIEEPGRLADTLVAHLSFKHDDRQTLLEERSVRKRLETILRFVQGEIEILQVEKKIKSRVKKQMERSQKEYYLNEQMHAIQKELGGKEEERSEMEELAQRIQDSNMSEEARERTEREFRKLKMMSPMSAEATVVRNYIDWMLALPWEETNKENLELKTATEVLDADHYGLEEVKERILDHLAVASLVEKIEGPILCLVGPPGVGKTSLARSIARATNREFVRQALGGVRDEAEIRGHRRTYIGAMPGKIIQSIKKAGSNNPVLLLDEIDKMSMDFRGDPSAALLEVLDPEQNENFQDHYLDVGYDLSKVFFLCTANTLQGIPVALRDRLEIIEVPGYTEEEKLAIAKRYLLPKQVKKNGLTDDQVSVTKQATETIIRDYTRESGVRNLDRQVAKVCRKVARRIVDEDLEGVVNVTSENIHDILGTPKFSSNGLEERDPVGAVKGMAVTPWGGELLDIEVAVVPGSGKLILTGRLGDWLKESAQAAFSYIRSRQRSLGLEADFHEKYDFHIHYPGNSLKTDGPSAGIAMATAMVSALTGHPVRRDIAMTGEISLRGRVLPIGGLKEKTMAAHRRGVTHVLLPVENAKDIPDIPEAVTDAIKMTTVTHLDEVLSLALRPRDGQVLFHAVPQEAPGMEVPIPAELPSSSQH
jgi:ATP-dependent Lon protease